MLPLVSPASACSATTHKTSEASNQNNTTMLTPSHAVKVVKGGNIDASLINAVFEIGIRIGITGDGTLRPNTSPRTRSSSTRRQQKKKECNKKSTPQREFAQA